MNPTTQDRAQRRASQATSARSRSAAPATTEGTTRKGCAPCRPASTSRRSSSGSTKSGTNAYDERNPAANPAALVAYFRRDIELVAARLRRHDDALRDDMKAVAFLRLLEAAERFDPSEGVRFYSFAKHRIKGAMLDLLRLSSQRGMNRPKRATYRVTGQDTLVCLLCSAVTPGAAETLMCAGCKAEHEPAEVAPRVFLYSELRAAKRECEIRSAEDPLSVDDLLPGAPEDLDAGVRRRQLADIIRRAAAAGGVTSREMLVLELRYTHEMTLGEIGVHIGVLAPRVSQLHKSALEALREGMRKCGVRQLRALL